MALSTVFCHTGKRTSSLIRALSTATRSPASLSTNSREINTSLTATSAIFSLESGVRHKQPVQFLHASSTFIPSKPSQQRNGPSVVVSESSNAVDIDDGEYANHEGARKFDDANHSDEEAGSAGRMPVTTLSSLGAHNPDSRVRQQQALHAPAGAALTRTQAESNGNGNGTKTAVPHAAVDGFYATFFNGRSSAGREQKLRYDNWEGHDLAIDEAASKQSVRLTPSTILYSGKSTNGLSHLIRSAQYLHRELPIRIAHRVAEFRTLPFIVGTNPNIRQVHDLYRKSFYILSEVPRIKTLEDEQNYSKLLLQIMENLRDVVSMLAQGFKETSAYMSHTDRRRFLDNMLTSRLGMRILGEHHLALHQAERANFVGLICVNMSVKKVVERWAEFCQELCLRQYGRAPNVTISGHVNATFPYITLPLDYILPELFKNAMRATCEHCEPDEPLPNIVATIAAPKKSLDFQIRISDRGGGMPYEALQRIFDYHFTTSTIRTHHRGVSTRLDPMTTAAPMQGSDDDPMDDMVALANPSRGPIGGFGFGLPTSRAYAEYFGGGLSVESLYGVGTDLYLRLKYFDGGAEETFRV